MSNARPDEHRVAGPRSGWSPETLQSLILDNLSDGVMALDLDWRIVALNTAAEKLLGHTREHAVGRHCYDLLRSTLWRRMKEFGLID